MAFASCDYCPKNHNQRCLIDGRKVYEGEECIHDEDEDGAMYEWPDEY